MSESAPLVPESDTATSAGLSESERAGLLAFVGWYRGARGPESLCEYVESILAQRITTARATAIEEAAQFLRQAAKGRNDGSALLYELAYALETDAGAFGPMIRAIRDRGEALK